MNTACRNLLYASYLVLGCLTISILIGNIVLSHHKCSEYIWHAMGIDMTVEIRGDLLYSQNNALVFTDILTTLTTGRFDILNNTIPSHLQGWMSAEILGKYPIMASDSIQNIYGKTTDTCALFGSSCK